jgi:tetratricopeptide (TPR) repeat protein
LFLFTRFRRYDDENGFLHKKPCSMNKSSRREKQVLAMAICLALSLSAKAMASTETVDEKGLQLYDQGSYEQSLEYLTKAAVARPSDPLVHYYLAAAYVHLGRHAEARKEYFACYCLDPTGRTSGYCRAALKAYGEPVPIDMGKSGSNGGVEGTSAKRIGEAVSQIRRQAQLQKLSKNDIANQGSITAGRIGEEEASRIQGAAYRRLNSRASYMMPYDFFNRDTEDPNLVMARAEEGMRLARRAAKQKADDYQKWSKDQEKAVDDIAANLESQLKNSNVKGGARLRAEGTGFYVRFYGHERNGALPDIHPSVARIGTFGSEQSDLPEEGAPKKSVKGDVLRP